MGFKVEQDFLHMVGGVGESSYATNLRLQNKAIRGTRTIVEKAIGEVYRKLLPSRMVMADLGCSSGPNTLLVVTQAIQAVAVQCRKLQREPPEIQFFLNDLNNIFRSLEDHESELALAMADHDVALPTPPHYVAAIPGSFYGRLFPGRSVHFFHSSYSLMWLSKVPQELENGGKGLNNQNIYISRTSPPHVVEAYQRQYRRNFSAFLRARHAELCTGGRMVLTFLGRTEHYPVSGELSHTWGLLAEALGDMASEGILPQEKLDSLNLPFYAPSMKEVKEVISQDVKGLFDLERAQIIQSNWDPFDDGDVDEGYSSMFNNVRSGKNVANCIRAVIEPVIKRHFRVEEDEWMLDELFSKYAKKVSRHLQKERTKYPVFLLALKTSTCYGRVEHDKGMMMKINVSTSISSYSSDLESDS